MKYAIISLQSGRVESIGPLLLIKANPLQESEGGIKTPLPEAMHKESQNTQNFAYFGKGLTRKTTTLDIAIEQL